MFERSLFVLNIGWPEMVMFAVVLIVVFGATQIPKIARSLGEGLKEFKKAVKEAKDTDDDEDVAAPIVTTKKKVKREKAKIE